MVGELSEERREKGTDGEKGQQQQGVIGKITKSSGVAWRKALEERGMRISRPKIQFMDFNFGQDNGQEREPVKILGEELQRVHHFKYLGSSVEETGGIATENTQRVSAA